MEHEILYSSLFQRSQSPEDFAMSEIELADLSTSRKLPTQTFTDQSNDALSWHLLPYSNIWIYIKSFTQDYGSHGTGLDEGLSYKYQR